jgi:hypothetical protein
MARYEACIGWLGIAPIPRSPGTWLNPRPPGPKDPDPDTSTLRKSRGTGGRLTCSQTGRLERAAPLPPANFVVATFATHTP